MLCACGAVAGDGGGALFNETIERPSDPFLISQVKRLADRQELCMKSAPQELCAVNP
jgi:hypothetical protein